MTCKCKWFTLTHIMKKIIYIYLLHGYIDSLYTYTMTFIFCCVKVVYIILRLGFGWKHGKVYTKSSYLQGNQKMVQILTQNTYLINLSLKF